MPRDDSVIWSESELDALRRDFADVYESRTCLVTGEPIGNLTAGNTYTFRINLAFGPGIMFTVGVK